MVEVPRCPNSRHSKVFVSIHGRSRGVTNIRNMLLRIFSLLSQHIRKQAQAILIDGKAFVVTVGICKHSSFLFSPNMTFASFVCDFYVGANSASVAICLGHG